MTEEPLTEEQAKAFRAYIHNLNRLAAIEQGEDPDRICGICGEDVDNDVHRVGDHDFTKEAP
jgi:hypothetical protein